MNLWINLGLQLVGVVGNFLATSNGAIPAKWSPVISAAQAVVGVIAHYYNTDGTPQSVAKQ
jgi:hypothetical protein